MPAVFPLFVSGDVWLAPTTRKTTAPTRVVQFLDDTEQRWRTGDFQESWVLAYEGLTYAEVEDARDFFDTVKGADDATWTFPFEGTSYTKMALEEDGFSAVETEPSQWSLTLRIRQTEKSAVYATGVTAEIPSLCQLPFTQGARFRTVRNDLASGARYSRYTRGTALGAWTLAFLVLTATELGALLNLFASLGGRYGTVQFTDPQTGTVYPNCRFDTDVFEAKYLGAGQYSVTLPVVEFAV